MWRSTLRIFFSSDDEFQLGSGSYLTVVQTGFNPRLSDSATACLLVISEKIKCSTHFNIYQLVPIIQGDYKNTLWSVEHIILPMWKYRSYIPVGVSIENMKIQLFCFFVFFLPSAIVVSIFCLISPGSPSRTCVWWSLI